MTTSLGTDAIAVWRVQCYCFTVIQALLDPSLYSEVDGINIGCLNIHLCVFTLLQDIKTKTTTITNLQEDNTKLTASLEEKTKVAKGKQ